MSGRLPREAHVHPIFDIYTNPAELKQAEQYVGEDGSLSARKVGKESFEVYLHDEVVRGGVLIGAVVDLSPIEARLATLEADSPDDFVSSANINGSDFEITLNNGDTITTDLSSLLDNINIIPGIYNLDGAVVSIPLTNGATVDIDTSALASDTELMAAIAALPPEEFVNSIIVSPAGVATFTTTEGNVAGTLDIAAVANSLEDFLEQPTLSGTVVTFPLALGAEYTLDLGAFDERLVDNSDGTFTFIDGDGTETVIAQSRENVISSDGAVIVTASSGASGEEFDITNPNPLIDPGFSTARFSANANSITAGKTVDSHLGLETSFGINAGQGSTGTSQTNFGRSAGQNSAGNNNVNIGQSAGLNKTGRNSTLVGAFAGQNTDGEEMVSVGYRTAADAQNAGRSVSIGDLSIAGVENAFGTVAVGWRTGFSAGNLRNSVLVGHGAGNTAGDITSSFVAGNEAARNGGKVNNSFLYGNFRLGGWADLDGVVAINTTRLQALSATNVTLVGNNAGLNAMPSGAPQNGTVVGQTLNIPGHGLTVDDIISGFVTGSNLNAALPSGFIVVDADNLQLNAPLNLTSPDGTAITFDLSTLDGLTNSSAFGAGALVTKPNQVVLGNSLVDEVFSFGDAIFNGTFYPSDERLKKNFKPLEGSAQLLSELDVGTFEWDFDSPTMTISEEFEEEYTVEPAIEEDVLDDQGNPTGEIVVKTPAVMGVRKIPAVKRVAQREEGRTQFGLIAQQVQKAMPEAVKERDGILVVDYGKVSVASIAALKEVVGELEEVKGRLDANAIPVPYFQQAANIVIFDKRVTESFPTVKRILAEVDDRLLLDDEFKALSEGLKARRLAEATFAELNI